MALLAFNHDSSLFISHDKSNTLECVTTGIVRERECTWRVTWEDRSTKNTWLYLGSNPGCLCDRHVLYPLCYALMGSLFLSGTRWTATSSRSRRPSSRSTPARACPAEVRPDFRLSMDFRFIPGPAAGSPTGLWDNRHESLGTCTDGSKQSWHSVVGTSRCNLRMLIWQIIWIA